MNSKIIIAVISAIVISSSIIAFSVIGNNDLSVSESTKNPVYIPSNITKVNPNVLVSTGGSSSSYSHVSQLAEHIAYTLEGTVVGIDKPVLWVSTDAVVRASIPVTMSVAKVHKGNLESNTFTFYLTTWAVFIDGKIARNYSLVDEDLSFVLPHQMKDFTLSEIINSQDKVYALGPESAQFEVGDKIIIHLRLDNIFTSMLDDGSAPMITDYDLTPYYTTVLGKQAVYKIQNDVIFNSGGNVEEYSVIINESQIDQVPIYIPSDITKANPNFVVENGEQSWVTTNIEDVKDKVIFTLQGTVLSIDDPIDWKSGVFHEYVEDGQIIQEEQIHGFIPITISVENVYKGNLTDETFTFYGFSQKYNDQYNLSPDTAHFEIGEKVLVHLAHSDLGSFPDGHYYVKLSQFGKYQINESNIAFNVHHPNGISINIAAGESLP